ncbi:MAG: hypothetical protein LBB41_06655 [Prevotellaceae bacterium]|nr:hypothetical protein [Prevotellaceae bacterium]
MQTVYGKNRLGLSGFLQVPPAGSKTGASGFIAPGCFNIFISFRIINAHPFGRVEEYLVHTVGGCRPNKCVLLFVSPSCTDKKFNVAGD